MIIDVKTSLGSYDIVLERGALDKVDKLLNLDRKVLVVTDSGVPKGYSQKVLEKASEGFLLTIPEGEGSKNIENLQEILKSLVLNGFTRTDCVVAVGGGVVGDMAGFAASVYMRGIDFYNIPTTVLSQVDSSIGGKVAIDFNGVKNIIGAFYQPKRVIIDPNTLKTLDKRQVNNGLCEAIKMAATSDKELFELIEGCKELDTDIDRIIEKALLIKKNVVEIDPKEKGLRKILNFGHTIGHAIESDNNLGQLLHGECVSLGMLPMCSENVRARLEKLLIKYNLPTKIESDTDSLISYIGHDKKASGKKITVIYVSELGSYEMREIEIEQIKEYINGEA